MASADVSPAPRSRGPIIIAVMVVILLVLHQDNWFWTDQTLVFGFLPIALFYHACISIAAAATWALATKIAWPLDDAIPATGNDFDSPGNEHMDRDQAVSDRTGSQPGEAS